MTAERIVNVSGGMGSAVALLRTIDRYGKDGTLAVFADTRWEDADTYRFLDDVERVAGLPIVRLSDGRNIWDVFSETAFFTTMQGGCKASWELKKLPITRFAEEHGKPETTTHLVGFGPDEYARQERLRQAIHPWKVDFPLTWNGYSHRCDLTEELRAKGIEPPLLYAKGYPHNNCGGACILAGISQWAGLLADNRELYLESERREQDFLAELRRRGRTVITILKDRRGGEVNNLSLRQLREEIEAGVRVPRDTWRETTCSCMGRLFAV